ncbi:MAG: NUDIX hydrolase [Euryarchaeota archaeon]|nr:NUDIX hydrolase [Euryarchaeota archaeon]
MDPTSCKVHKLVADIAALSGGKVLLVRYKDVSKYDNQKGWFLPDDYLNFDEHPDGAPKRILKEQAGVSVDGARMSHIESFVGNGAWHLVFHYKVELPIAPPLALGGNVAEARWFPLDRLPPRKDVSHGGWAIDVLNTALGRAR